MYHINRRNIDMTRWAQKYGHDIGNIYNSRSLRLMMLSSQTAWDQPNLFVTTGVRYNPVDLCTKCSFGTDNVVCYNRVRYNRVPLYFWGWCIQWSPRTRTKQLSKNEIEADWFCFSLKKVTSARLLKRKSLPFRFFCTFLPTDTF